MSVCLINSFSVVCFVMMSFLSEIKEGRPIKRKETHRWFYELTDNIWILFSRLADMDRRRTMYLCARVAFVNRLIFESEKNLDMRRRFWLKTCLYQSPAFLIVFGFSSSLNSRSVPLAPCLMAWQKFSLASLQLQHNF